MTDCGTSEDPIQPQAPAPTPLRRPASWQDYEEYERWLARDAARLAELARLPQRLSINATAEFLHVSARDIGRAIDAGELAAITMNGQRYVLTRALLSELGVHHEGTAS